MTRPSREKGGLSNYTQLLDWRRDQDRLKRREGADYFWPNRSADDCSDVDYTENPGDQPFLNRTTRVTVASFAAGVATFDTPHGFSEGELFIIVGGDGTVYTATEVTRLTFETEATLSTDDVIESAEPITVMLMARRPNNQTAFIAGTRTRLFRFMALTNNAYFEGNCTDCAYFEEPVDAEGNYFLDLAADWMQIAGGFSKNGHRWEAINIAGWTVFNNGVDLPVTYRVEETEAVPIYELREQGIACVGTIAEHNGILMCGDISEFIAAEFRRRMRRLPSPFQFGEESGLITATVSSTTLTASAPFFDITTPVADDCFDTPPPVATRWIGRTIEFEDGQTTDITAVASSTSVSVNPGLTISTGLSFTVRTKFSQAGSTFTAPITLTWNGTTLTASNNIFVIGMIGWTVRLANGQILTIAGFTNPTTVTVVESTGSSVGPFVGWLIGPTANQVTAAAAYFTDDMVGLRILWDDGSVRKIVDVISSTVAEVDSDIAIASGLAGVENPEAYAPVSDPRTVNRIHWRVIWSQLYLPRRFGVVIRARIEKTNNVLTLEWPSKSFESGQEVVVVGAGVDGGNLSTTIAYIGGGLSFVLTDAADTTVEFEDGQLIASDAVGSITAFEDLQDDGSGILRMLDLDGTCVTYKETCLFLAQFTGDAAQPFVFRRVEIPRDRVLYHRNTLVTINGAFHVYAGRDRFYTFDLGTKQPRELEAAELCSDLFFNNLDLEDTESIYAADNELTHEVWFRTGDLGENKCLCYDYRWQRFSTTSFAPTAAATVRKPEGEPSYGAAEVWFVMAVDGCLLQYGLAIEDQAGWNDAREIYYRVDTSDFSLDKVAYASVLTSALSNFGQSHNEKMLNEYVLILADRSFNTTVEWELLQARNPGDYTAPAVANYTMTQPQFENLIPLNFGANFFADRLTVDGYDNPISISERIWRGFGLSTHSHDRHSTA